MKTKEKIIDFIKREIVLTVAIILAVITCFIVPPDKEYLKYFDYSTLHSVFSLYFQEILQEFQQ